MKAAILYEANTPLKIEEVTLDDPQDREVMVKTMATGVCHTDLHFMQNQTPGPVPMIPGHEVAGIVEKVGPGVTTLKPGDHVVVMVTFSCGICHFCVKGRPTRCTRIVHAMGAFALPDGGIRTHKGDQDLYPIFGIAGFAEHVVVHERQAVKVRDDAPFDVICLLGCGVSTGIGAAINRAKIKAGESIVIYGCGGVGLSAIMGAKLAGAGTIIAVDIMDNKLEMAREFGADYLINANQDDPQSKIMEITGEGADCALECVGKVDAINQAFGSIHNDGKCLVVGMAPIESFLTIMPYELMLGKTLTGSIQGDIIASVDIPGYVDMFMDGKLPIDKLVSRTYSLDQVNDAFTALEKGEVMRSVIKIA